MAVFHFNIFFFKFDGNSSLDLVNEVKGHLGASQKAIDLN